jgi:hypothetical protein
MAIVTVPVAMSVSYLYDITLRPTIDHEDGSYTELDQPSSFCPQLDDDLASCDTRVDTCSIICSLNFCIPIEGEM